jgi:hypothetical protein
MELVLLAGLLMLWLAVALAVAVVVGQAVRLRDRVSDPASAAQRPDEVLHLGV